jgi:hypothetical protein
MAEIHQKYISLFCFGKYFEKGVNICIKKLLQILQSLEASFKSENTWNSRLCIYWICILVSYT